MLSHLKVIFCILTLSQAIETYFHFVHSTVQLFKQYMSDGEQHSQRSSGYLLYDHLIEQCCFYEYRVLLTLNCWLISRWLFSKQQDQQLTCIGKAVGSSWLIRQVAFRISSLNWSVSFTSTDPVQSVVSCHHGACCTVELCSMEGASDWSISTVTIAVVYSGSQKKVFDVAAIHLNGPPARLPRQGCCFH